MCDRRPHGYTLVEWPCFVIILVLPHLVAQPVQLHELVTARSPLAEAKQGTQMHRTPRHTWATSRCGQMWTPWSCRLNPGRRGHREEENRFDAPSTSSQPSSHGWRGWRTNVCGGASCVMDSTKVVDTTHERHACLMSLHAMSRMATSTRQRGQVFAEGGMQPFDPRGGEHASSVRQRRQFQGPFDASVRHAPSDLNDTRVLRVCDHGGDQQVWPADCSPETPPTRRDARAEGAWQPRICESAQSARPVSRVRLTTPASHSRVETIMASLIQAVLRRPVTRISSAWTGIRSRRQPPDAAFGSGAQRDLASSRQVAHRVRTCGHSPGSDSHTFAMCSHPL